MSKRFTFLFFLLTTIFLDVGSAVFLAYKLNSDLALLLHSITGLSVMLLLAFVLIWLFLGIYFSIYILRRADRFLRLTLRLLSHLFTLFVFTEVMSVSLFSRTPKIEDVLLIALMFITQLVYRFLFFSSIRLLRKKKQSFKDNVILLGDETHGIASFIQNNPQIGYNILEIDLDNDVNITKDFFDKKKVSAVFTHKKNITKKTYKKVMEQIALLQTSIFTFASHDDVLKSDQVDYFGFIPVYKTQFSPLLQGINSAIKRGFDIVFSSLVILLILSWTVPLIGLLIRLESKGSVFFIQDRNGLGNKLFRCYKFRSMTINSNKNQAQRDDIRITTIGRFIRKTSIDELPQFYNVLKGDMSVVGPRPHMEVHNKNYEKHVDSFQLRHSVKPGITGMAQMRGFRGEIIEDLDIINRIKYDIFYIRHWSFALDIKIIIRTVLNIIRGEEKAY
jgi:putative colanic acid biosynthesis UDP-glucose lipid carrier transferase